MEISYKRNLKASYLTIRVRDEVVNMYQMRMITANKIDGLLPCQIKEEENGKVCYYEISCKQSLQHLYLKSEIGYEELKHLLIGIYMILQRLEKYLLQSTYLILEPEYIYLDWDKRQVCLVYLPGYEGDGFKAVLHLARRAFRF